ncbi:MAG: TetR/AcrR family transcriptional regulator [Gaiellaceae bacterium]
MPAEPRTPLNRDRVLSAALGLADSSGVEALTMRRLGEELGFEAMSLYRYVASKKDLLDGMLDLVLAEWQLPDGGGDWPDAIRTSAHSVHDALRRHPWAARLLMTGGHMRPARLRYMDRLLATLREGGFDADVSYHVYHLLDGYIFGYSLWEIAYTAVPIDADVVSKLMQTIPWDDYPDLAEHRDQHMNEGPHREVSAFEVGLDLILAGLQQQGGKETA